MSGGQRPDVGNLTGTEWGTSHVMEHGATADGGGAAIGALVKPHEEKRMGLDLEECLPNDSKAVDS